MLPVVLEIVSRPRPVYPPEGEIAVPVEESSDRVALEFSIQMLPDVGVVSGHATGSAKQSDVDGMIAWLWFNDDVVVGFFTGAVTAREFDAALTTANPYLSVQP